MIRTALKAWLRDKPVEPTVRWAWKRARGIPIPFDNVRNEIYDRQAFDLIDRVLRSDSNCIDVGCHRGDYLRRMLATAPSGHHFAFEPIPDLAAALRRDFPTVEVHEVALSDRAGTAEFFYFPSKPALSGLALREARTGGAGEHLQVRTARLDELVSAATPIRLLKIDVEGAEDPVLDGARHLMLLDRPFVVLEHGKDSAAFGWPSDRLYELLCDEYGLKLALLAGWLHARRPLSKAEFLRALNHHWHFVAYPPA